MNPSVKSTIRATILCAGLGAAIVHHSPCQAQATAPAGKETSQTLPAGFDKKYSGLVKEQKYDEAQQLLRDQLKLTPDDPDLAVMRANLNLLMPEAQSRIVINQLPEGQTKPPDNVKQPFSLVDVKTSEPTGYLGEYKPEEQKTAISDSLAILKKASASHPDRLDIRSGISQLHAMNEDYASVLENHEEIIKYAASKDYKGLVYAKGRAETKARQALSSDLHHYYLEYTQDTESPDDKLAFRLAEAVTRYFPEDVRGWNDLAAEYAQQKQIPKAIECLQKAHEIDKKDGIVMMNIAHFYVESKQPKKAIEWYQKVVDLKDPELSGDAKAEIKELQEKEKGDAESE